jgi:type IV pilus assembly protein PilC
LIYPLIICIVAVLVVVFIITLVMPMFVGMFQSSGVELPLPTRILLDAGGFIRTWGLFLMLGVLATFLLLKRWGKTKDGRYFFDNFYLHIPLLGKTINRIAVARFARTMGNLVKSGIPVLQALEVMEEVVGNAVIGQAIAQASSSIKEGETINLPLMATGVFEPMVTQMIAVGEETGTLDQMLMRMSDYYERELLHTVDALLAIIEPLLVLLVAIIVGLVVVATLLPVFDMTTLIG